MSAIRATMTTAAIATMETVVTPMITRPLLSCGSLAKPEPRTRFDPRACAALRPARVCARLAPGIHTAAVDERATLTQARSMLILLLATCKQTQLALEAAANELDTDLTTELVTMTERTEHELVVLTEKIHALHG
jgi:hypothetical protein